MSDAMKTAKSDTAPRTGAEALTEFERDQIRRRARAIWREEGCPKGRDHEHWAMAELQVLKSGLRP